MKEKIYLVVENSTIDGYTFNEQAAFRNKKDAEELLQNRWQYIFNFFTERYNKDEYDVDNERDYKTIFAVGANEVLNYSKISIHEIELY